MPKGYSNRFVVCPSVCLSVQKTLSWTIFKELLGLHIWYLTESIYAWRANTAYWIFHDWVIQKGVAGLRIISIKKTLSLTIFKEVLGLHRWYLTESTYAWRAFTTFWIFHDPMIQKDVAGLRIISIKNFVVDHFQRSSRPTLLILDWKYLCMKSKYCILDFSWLNDPKGRGKT